MENPGTSRSRKVRVLSRKRGRGRKGGVLPARLKSLWCVQEGAPRRSAEVQARR